MATTANDNREWWQVHIPGQTIAYGDWQISYNPPPIPVRNCDWQYCHKDFDGAEDACDDRYGSSGSLMSAMIRIDDLEDEAWDEKGCSECSLCSSPSGCLKAGPCRWRDGEKRRRELYAVVSAQVPA